ncbi:hypothetical protein ACS0TY_011180 [Phlomoides rotata]
MRAGRSAVADLSWRCSGLQFLHRRCNRRSESPSPSPIIDHSTFGTNALLCVNNWCKKEDPRISILLYYSGEEAGCIRKNVEMVCGLWTLN